MFDNFNAFSPLARHTAVPQTLLDYYKAIEGASRQMLEAAQQEDWDQVVRLEGLVPC